MMHFDFSFPTRVHFGIDVLERALASELANMGNTVMLAYGGSSLKENGV